jgi:hypothetical protein
VTAELAQFPASQGMRCWRAALEPVDVQLAPGEVDLLPLQVGHLRGAQAVAVGHQDHERVSIAVPVAPRRLDRPLDLFGPQMLPLAQVFVFGAGRRLDFQKWDSASRQVRHATRESNRRGFRSQFKPPLRAADYGRGWHSGDNNKGMAIVPGPWRAGVEQASG